MLKRLLAAFTVIMLVGFIFASAGLAKSLKGKEGLVALGDSITFGFNLEKTNDRPSKKAFPYLIDNDSKKDFRVRNLSVPGWTSTQLLNALQHDQTFRNSVKHAELVTLNIGSNDLLDAIELNALTPSVIANMLNNINLSLLEIQSLAPDAKIVVYNIYYPLRPEHPLFGSGAAQLPPINEAIAQIVASRGNPNIVLADAYTAIGANPLLYILPGDVHPTAAGQEALAEAAEDALARATDDAYAEDAYAEAAEKAF